MDLAPGTKLGPYEIQAPLGAGGMGVVYRAHDSRLKRTVALKVLRAEVAQSPDRLRRFESEARAAGALNHPNILAVFDTGTAEGVPYVVTELLEGETLRERLSAGPLRPGKVLEYAVQIAEGLGAAHDKGIVHRDLKPENLFLTKDGRVKILDFGLAKLRDDVAGTSLGGSETRTLANATETGAILGTVGYMSPEQVRALPADYRSDVFSFGAVLFEMLTGRRAFLGDSSAETMTEILRADPVAGLATAEGGSLVELGVQRLLARCLEKKAEDRYQSARDLAFHLRSLGESSGVLRSTAKASGSRASWLLPAAAMALVAAAGLGVLAGRSSRPEPTLPSYKPLTFGQGVVTSARFGPDKATVYYSVEQSGRPMEILSTWGDSRVSRPVGVKDAKLLAVSRQGEMAVLLHPLLEAGWIHRGTLARVSVSGGTPREVLEDVEDADFAPDGESLAVVHWVEGPAPHVQAELGLDLRAVESRCRLEFPIGRVLYAPSPPTWLSVARVSPRGDRIAFLEHPVANDLRGVLSVVDLRGQRTTIGAEFATVVGLAWSGSDDLLLSGERGAEECIYVARIGGNERLIARPPGSLTVLDVAPGGRSLLRREAFSAAVWGRGPASSHEQNLSDRDLSYVVDISVDGQVVVGTWQDPSAGPSDSVFLQRMEVSPPVRLGDGDALSLSRDGRWVLARLPPHPGERLVVVPTGAGETTELPAGDVQRYYEGKWFPDGRRVVFSGAKEGSPPRLFVQDVGGGAPRPLSPEGYSLPRLGASVSPDGQRVVALDPEGTPVLYPLEGGAPGPVPSLLKGDAPIAWTADGNGLFYFDASEPAARIHRLDLRTGRTQLWRELLPSRPSGMFGDYRILVTPDGGSYAYNYSSVRADLLLAEGLR